MEKFLRDYLSIKDFALPFELIPGFGNFISTYTDIFTTEPLNEKFFDEGYETMSLILNFADDLLSWVLIGFTYIILKLVNDYLPLCKCL